MKHKGTLFQLKKVTGEKNIPKIWKDFEPIEIMSWKLKKCDGPRSPSLSQHLIDDPTKTCMLATTSTCKL